MSSSKPQDNSAAMPPPQQQQAAQPAQQQPQQTSPQQQHQPAPAPAQQLSQAIAQQPQLQQQQPAQQPAQHQPHGPSDVTQGPSPQTQVQPGLPAPASAQQAAVAAAAAAATVPVSVPQGMPNASPTIGENLVCQWQGCQERSPTAEALYEHVCERHVGRKSTNNLNLTCGWANCRTTTVKRDHITSHIRVHVPLKPHKCEFCGKAFKRPQDLKKHVKTHADDSVLVRSPEPGPGSRPPNGMFNVPTGPEGRPTHYFEGSLGPVPGPAYGHPPPPHYYQPAQHHPQHQPNPSYGSVYYAVGGDASHQAAYESKKRGYDALNEFFGDLKRRQFDPASYAAIGQRLLNLHGLPLPLVNNGPAAEYQTAPAMVAAGGGGGGGGGGAGGYGPSAAPAPGPGQPYHLPPMANLRSKADVMNIDQFLEQMQATVFESDDQVAASGVAQPGAHYIQGPMSYRTTNSPPAVATQPQHYNTAGTPTTSGPGQVASTSHAARSPHSATPALTPPSSAQSYTSNRSPISLSSTQHGIPGAQQHQQQQQPQSDGRSNSGMYPTLPSTTAQEQSGYAPVSSAAPPSTLSSVFDNDDRRRYTGGMLQRSRPAPSESMDQDEHMEDVRRDTTPLKTATNVIDPALRRASEDMYAQPHSSEQSGSNATTPDAEGQNQQPSPEQAVWVENVRILCQLRDYIKSVLSDMEMRESNGESNDSEEQQQQQTSSHEMADSPGENRQPSTDEMDTDNLYPVLRAHLDADEERDRMRMDES